MYIKQDTVLHLHYECKKNFLETFDQILQQTLTKKKNWIIHWTDGIYQSAKREKVEAALKKRYPLFGNILHKIRNQTCQSNRTKPIQVINNGNKNNIRYMIKVFLLFSGFVPEDPIQSKSRPPTE